MIHIGRVTEDMVRLHAKTSKYLDGSLDFLDPYIFEIPDSNLPGSVHQFFDSAFGANTSSHMSSFVDAEKLIIVKENSYLEVIKDYKMETGTEPTSILPNIENEDSDSEKQPLFDLGPNETINNDLIVEYDPHDVLFLEVTNVTSILDNVETIATASTNSLEEIIAKNNEEKRPPINLARFLVKYSKTAETDEQTIDLKEYMNDLAELLCNRMEPEKRKLFLCQVDLMVSELLEGT